MLMDRKKTATERRDVLIAVLLLTVWLGGIGVVIYIAAHFILKFW